MCAICGAFAYKSLQLPQPGICRQMRDSMAARGPDGSGEWQTADDRKKFVQRTDCETM